MAVKPPAHKFRVDQIDVSTVIRQKDGLPEIHYQNREVEKIVEKVIYKDDPKLLERLNKALKENGDLKQRVEGLPKVESPVVERINFVDRIKVVNNQKIIIITGIVSSLMGAILCYLILK